MADIEAREQLPDEPTTESQAVTIVTIEALTMVTDCQNDFALDVSGPTCQRHSESDDRRDR